ncbi:hypothetical protein [Flammeovirga agarivorans]|uniref:Tetratricopeptide repeat protein n=1 Tax=Flammeovirga agarivorans TaxID=2726742 RepID=A0A7X8SHU3_9BACT|nr:hypothetical protein [Flammeovirga agarivorans]NLR90523.1 hypothetical protein [Flammeovirga agarivorans]
MDLTLIEKWLKNPQSVSYRDIDDIKAAIENYPYFAALHVLLAKAEEGKAEYVKSAAAYVTHRPSLQAYLNTTFDSDINLPDTSGIEIESDEHETLDKLSDDNNDYLSISDENEEVDDILEHITNESEASTNHVIEEEVPDEDNDSIVDSAEDESNFISDTQEVDEATLEDQILNDLEHAEDLQSTEEVEQKVDTSIADEILAELAKLSAQQEQPEGSEPTSFMNEEDKNDEEEIISNHTIESETASDFQEEQTEDEYSAVNDAPLASLEDESNNIMSSEEMMDRFQGFLNTKKQSEEEIIKDLSEDENIDSDTLSITSKEENKVEETSDGFTEYSFPSYDTSSFDETIKDEDYLHSVDNMNDENIIDFNNFDPVQVDKKGHQKNIIDNFIEVHPSISQNELDLEEQNLEQIDLSDQALQGYSIPQTESFAKLLEKQGKKDEAISIYQHLILKNPNKASFFAERIEFLKKD